MQRHEMMTAMTELGLKGMAGAFDEAVTTGLQRKRTTMEVLTDLLRDWWQPPAELIATLPKGGVSLQYLGHADTTRALIEADPCWTWEPMGRDANGQPVLERDDAGRPVGLWIWGTVCGVTRPAYGSCDAGKREAIKELIGDAIRNLALRFGA